MRTFSLGLLGNHSRSLPRDQQKLIELARANNFPNVSKIAASLYRNRNTYRSDLSQSITDSAGLPSGIIAGVQAGQATGLTVALGTLTVYGNEIFSTNALSSAAESGSGTELDPWIVSERDYTQVLFSGSNTGWTKFVNCRFANGSDLEIYFQSSFAGNIIFENCEFYDAHNTATTLRDIRIDCDMILRFDKCYFGGSASNEVFSLVTTSMSSGLTIEMTNCLIRDSEQAYAAGTEFIRNTTNGTVNVTIDIQNCEFFAANAASYIIDLGTNTTYPSITFNNNKVSGEWCSIIRTFPTMVSAKITNLEFQNNQIFNTTEQIIDVMNVKGGIIRHNEFIHDTGGADARMVVLNGSSSVASSGCEDVDVSYNRFTKTTGTKVAGNEVLESFYGKNITFRYNYVTQCPEDAFEHVNSLSGNTVEYCVAENCAGEVVDYFFQWDEASWSALTDTSAGIGSASYVHHIYGDCAAASVIISGIKGMAFHDIYVDNTAATMGEDSVRIEDRNDGSVDRIVRDILGAGPLPSVTVREGAVVSISGGDNIQVNYFDDLGNGG